MRVRWSGRWLAWWGAWSALVVTGGATAARITDPAPYDLVAFSRAGLAVLTGHGGGVYASPWLQAGPFELIASYLMLPQELPLDRAELLATPPGGLLVLTRLVAGAVLVGVTPLLVRRLRGWCDLPASPGAELAAAGLCLLLRVPISILAVGHLAQPAICLLWVLAAVAARRGRIGSAAVLIGLSAGWEPWGVLGASMLLLARDPDRNPDRDKRRLPAAGLVVVAVAAACYAPFALAGPFRLLDHSWPISPFTLVHQIWPGAVRFDWYMRAGQALIAVAAGGAVVLAGRRLPDVVWAAPVAIVLGRLLLDPLALDYYWLPVGMLAVAGCGLMTRRGLAVRAGVIAVLGVFASFPTVGTAFRMTVPDLAGLLTVGLPAVAMVGALAAIRATSRAERTHAC